jgi:hypothetical protein
MWDFLRTEWLWGKFLYKNSISNYHSTSAQYDVYHQGLVNGVSPALLLKVTTTVKVRVKCGAQLQQNYNTRHE